LSISVLKPSCLSCDYQVVSEVGIFPAPTSVTGRSPMPFRPHFFVLVCVRPIC
jgi:hypothetical protein